MCSAMQLNLTHASGGPAREPISPLFEMGAYEAMWLRPRASFKTIAETFKKEPGAVPSHFVPADEAHRCAQQALEIVEKGKRGRFSVRVHGAGEYPEKLRDAKYPVELLYYQGMWVLTETRCVSVVGTRHPTEDGLKRTAQLVRRLVEKDFTVVSGLAAGIDTAAHRAAIEQGGRTIAVLGTPLSSTYPKENAELQREIAEKWLVISQVPFCRYSLQGPAGNRLFFPERNVTMAALSEATIIVEAGETSGSLIQARNALEQRRKVMILNSCFERGLTWPERLEKHGAIRIRDFDEIIDRLDATPHRD